MIVWYVVLALFEKVPAFLVSLVRDSSDAIIPAGRNSSSGFPVGSMDPRIETSPGKSGRAIGSPGAVGGATKDRADVQALLSDGGGANVVDLKGAVVGGPGQLVLDRAGVALVNVVVSCDGGLAIRAEGCALEHVTITGVTGDDSVALDIVASRFRATECSVTKNAGYGVQMAGPISAELVACDVAKNGMHGIYAGGGAQVLLDQCKVHQNKDLGVLADDRGTMVTIMNGEVTGNHGTGLRATEGAHVTLTGLTLSRNTGPTGNGIMADGAGTNVEMNRGKITRNGGCGVIATDGARVNLKDLERLGFNQSHQVWAAGKDTVVQVLGREVSGRLEDNTAQMLQIGSQKDAALRVQDGAAVAVSCAMIGSPSAKVARVSGTNSRAEVTKCLIVDTVEAVFSDPIYNTKTFYDERERSGVEGPGADAEPIVSPPRRPEGASSVPRPLPEHPGN